MALRRLRTTLVIALLILLTLLAFRIDAFVHLFYTHAGQAWTQPEIAGAFQNGTLSATESRVPRIIHRVWHNWTDASNENLPEDWLESRRSCVELNQGWENWLWAANTSRTFLAENYAWFLPTYDGFQYPIQRVDAVRYFLIRHFGGIYIDLDNGCNTSLEPLRYFPAWVTDGGRGALSNNILAGSPGHPFWVMLTESIVPYAWTYPLPYLTISYATGQWFLTDIWEKYHRRLADGEPALARIMMDGRRGAAEWVFFSHGRGGTWEGWDNIVFNWIGDHLILTFLLVSGCAAFLILMAIGIAALAIRERRRGKGYIPITKLRSEGK